MPSNPAHLHITMAGFIIATLGLWHFFLPTGCATSHGGSATSIRDVGNDQNEFHFFHLIMISPAKPVSRAEMIEYLITFIYIKVKTTQATLYFKLTVPVLEYLI